jgi:hypothetical protein
MLSDFRKSVAFKDVPRLGAFGFLVEVTSQLMLYREIIAVCSEIHTKHINTLCGQNVELLNVKLAVHIVTTGIQMGTGRYVCVCWELDDLCMKLTSVVLTRP